VGMPEPRAVGRLDLPRYCSRRHPSGQARRRGAEAEELANPADGARAGRAEADAGALGAGEVVVRRPGSAVGREAAGREGDVSRAEL